MVNHVFVMIVTAFLSVMPPTAQSLSMAQTKCLAETVYFESRGEGVVGSTAVAYTALNRASENNETVCQVVHKSGQFTYYNPRHPRRVTDIDSWTLATEVALTTQLGITPNPIGNATFYNTTPMTSWTKEAVLSRRVNHHYFYVKKVHKNIPTLLTDRLRLDPETKSTTRCVMNAALRAISLQRPQTTADPKIAEQLGLGRSDISSFDQGACGGVPRETMRSIPKKHTG